MDEATDRLKEQAAKAQELYQQGLRRASDWTRAASVKSREAWSATDDWVRDKPWLALGVAAGVGLLVGLLIGQARTGNSEKETEEGK